MTKDYNGQLTGPQIDALPGRLNKLEISKLSTSLSNIDEKGEAKIKEIAKEEYSIQYDLTKNEPLPATLFLKNGAYDESPDKQCWYGQSSCYVNTPKVSNYLLTLAVKVTYEGATVTVDDKAYPLERGKSVSIPVKNKQKIDFLLSNWVWFNSIEVSENAIGILTEEVSCIDESLGHLEDVVNIDESIEIHNAGGLLSFIKMGKTEGIEIFQPSHGNKNKILINTNTLSFEVNDLGQLVIKANSSQPLLALGTSCDVLHAGQEFIIHAGTSFLNFKKSTTLNFSHPSGWTVDIQGSYQLDAKKGITLNANGGACYIYAGTADNPQKMEIGSKGVSYIQFNKDGNARLYGNVTFKGEVTFEKPINVKEINRDGDITINSKNIKWNEASVKEIPLHRTYGSEELIHEHEYTLDSEDGQIIIWSKSNLTGCTIQQLNYQGELVGSFVISKSTCAINIYSVNPEYTQYFLYNEYWDYYTESIKGLLPSQISHNLSQELSDIKELKQVVEDNEKVTAAALLDINSQINYRDYIRDVLKVTHEAGYDFSEMDVFLSILSYYCLQVRNMPNTATENQKPWSWILGIADEMDLSGLVYKDKMQFFIPVKTKVTEDNRGQYNACFENCINLLYIPTIDTSKVTDFQDFCMGCTNLISVGNIDMSAAIATSSMFERCSSLFRITGFLNSSSLQDTSWMFAECTSLHKVPTLDMTNASMTWSMFEGCINLEEFRFLNPIAKNYNNKEFSTCPKLRRDVLVQFFNDLPSTGGTRYEIALHHDAYNRLTTEDIAIATNKGYAVYSV